MATHHITIGPQFFRNELKEYADWHWAYIREAAQNCLDAKGSTRCEFAITEEGGNTIVRFGNDGEAMTEEILVGKFLALGESGKRFHNSCGGFGKAKTLLAMAHESYSIRTGSLRVTGSGGSYELERDLPYYDGTETTVVMEGEHSYELNRMIDRFIKYAQWDGTFFVDGEERKGELWKGSPRRDLGFAKVYTNRSHTYTMIVRVGGIPMFARGIRLNRCVIVELKGRSDEVLTSNRDGLVEPFASELSDFITELAVDKRSALKNRRRGPKYIQYRGKKMCHQRTLDVAEVVDLAATAVVDLAAERAAGTPELTTAGVTVSLDSPTPPTSYREDVGCGYQPAARDVVSGTYTPQRVATLGCSFILKNETDLKIPAYYDPGSGEFSEYSRKLVRIWGRLMVEMYRTFDVEGEFSIGFIFDDGEEISTEAEHENGDFGRVYYLNPCVVVEQSSTYSKSFKKRWKLNNEGKKRLLAVAAHEFVHGLGYNWHSEDFACKYTDTMGRVLAHVGRFTWCFK